MEILFLKLVNVSIAAGWLVLAVLLIRLLFGRAPRWIGCLLWGLVALRLICPFNIESRFSLIPSAEPLPQDIIYTANPRIESGVPAIDEIVNPVLADSLTPQAGASANPSQIWSFILSRLWAAVAAVMLLYALISSALLRLRVAAATRLFGNVKQSERVASPFVLGLFRPVIYLPYNMAEEDISYVIAHERAHIRRKDHWWKPLGFLLLSVYWFHPLLWLAYVLLCRDIEVACDEKVIRDLKQEERRAYSAALLRCSVRQRAVAACPLAFGETGVKQRIRGVMNYKKPAAWLVAAALAACGAAAVCLLTVPVRGGTPPASQTAEEAPSGLFQWFDYTDERPETDETSELTGILPGVTFRYSRTGAGDEITAEENGETVSLVRGMPVWNAYFLDVTGDGMPELCVTYSFGSGMIDTRFCCVDYLNGASYEMADRGVYDYWLRSGGDGQLYVDKMIYGDGARIATGPLVFEDDCLQAVWSEGEETGAVFLKPGRAYVSRQCLYMNPFSSYSTSEDAGFRYVIEDDSFIMIRLPGFAVPGGQSGGSGEAQVRETVPVARWEWQDFPYTDEEWKSLFAAQPQSSAMADLRAIYGEILYQPLSDNYFLLFADGALLMVELRDMEPMGKCIWSIYSLMDEAEMGAVQWEYAPLLSSRLPLFYIGFDAGLGEIFAACTEGQLVYFDAQGGERGIPSGTSMTFPAGNAVCWSPLGEDGSISGGAAIRFTCTRENGSSFAGTIYITADGGLDSDGGSESDGGSYLDSRVVYNAILTGNGLYLSSDEESGGGVVSPIAAEAAAGDAK